MPTPNEGESKKAYVSRCIGVRQNEHPDEDVKQSSAVCYSMWDQAKKKKLEKIEEIEIPGAATSHGATNAEPQQILSGQYPEFEQIDLPENLTKRPWERDWQE